MKLEIIDFLDELLAQIDKTDINVSRLKLDHVAYQAASTADYEQKKREFAELGTQLHEAEIHERRVAIFRLLKPIKYLTYQVEALEVLEPKPGQDTNSFFEHAEFIVPQNLTQFANKYSIINWDRSSLDETKFSHLKLHFKNGLTVKFLNYPILELVGAE